MPNRHTEGVDPQDQAQAAVEQASVLMVASPLAHHPPEPAAALPTGDAIPRAWGKPQAGALEQWGRQRPHRAAMEARDMAPYSATGRLPQHPRWPSYCGAATRAPASGGPSAGTDGRQTSHREGRCDRPLAHMSRRTGAGPYHSHRGLSPMLAAGLAGRRWRMLSGGSGRQLEASAPRAPGEGCLLRLGGTEPGVRSWAQRPNGQTCRIHQDALG